MAPIRIAGAAALLGLLGACAQPVSTTRFPAPAMGGEAAPAHAAPAHAAPAQAAPVMAAPTQAPPAATAQPGSDRAFVVFFEEWSAALSEPAQAGLARVAEMAARNARVPVLVLGYTGPRGSSEANALLSRLRARMVADALIERGVASRRIRIVSRGPTPGFESLESRRVEVRIDDGRR
jgi:outer membrane protein OmpA-like peptidoglycan-associated protein